MKYPFPSPFIVAVMALSHCMTYISGSPVPGDAGTDAQSQGPKCNISPRPNNPDRYLYTGKGRPSPSDLKVSNLWLPWPRGVEVNPGFAENKTGVPADLSSFAVMRSLVELDIQNIEKLLPYDDSIGNKDCSVDILGYKVEDIGTFAVINYDRFKREALWPAIIQSGVFRRLIADYQDWDNMASGPGLDDDGEPIIRTTHDIDALVGNSTRRIAEMLWNEGLNKTGKAVTTTVPLDAQGGPDFAKVDDIISIIRNAAAPALMATKKNLVGSLEPETIYTLAKRESGGLIGRNARVQPGDPLYEREIHSSEIINNAKFLTYFVQ